MEESVPSMEATDSPLELVLTHFQAYTTSCAGILRVGIRGESNGLFCLDLNMIKRVFSYYGSFGREKKDWRRTAAYIWNVAAVTARNSVRANEDPLTTWISMTRLWLLSNEQHQEPIARAIARAIGKVIAAIQPFGRHLLI